jgi:hypothetical protein
VIDCSAFLFLVPTVCTYNRGNNKHRFFGERTKELCILHNTFPYKTEAGGKLRRHPWQPLRLQCLSMGVFRRSYLCTIEETIGIGFLLRKHLDFKTEAGGTLRRHPATDCSTFPWKFCLDMYNTGDNRGRLCELKIIGYLPGVHHLLFHKPYLGICLFKQALVVLQQNSVSLAEFETVWTVCPKFHLGRELIA